MRLGVGIVLAVFALLFYKVGQSKLEKEVEVYEQALSEINKEGEIILYSGKISEENQLLVNDFVVASKEEFTGFGKHNGFKVVEEHLQPTKLDSEEDSILLVFEHTPHRGMQIAHQILEEKTSSGKPIKYQGLKKGVSLSVLGEVVETSPDKVKVLYAFADTPENYHNFLYEGQEILKYLSGALAILSAIMFVWYFRSRKENKMS